VRFLLVLLGGGIGSLARYTAGMAITERFSSRFPIGTMVINVTGSFLIGIIMSIITERLPGDLNWRPLLVTGFLGGYTTFSSFEWETYAAIRHGGLWIGVANVIGSVVLGYAAVWLGAVIVKK
jgi:fluoride exporter